MDGVGDRCAGVQLSPASERLDIEEGEDHHLQLDLAMTETRARYC